MERAEDTAVRDTAERQVPTTPLRVMLVYGTRPEAIKMAPLALAMDKSPQFEPICVVTGQHREMLDQVNAFFGITPDIDLGIHRPGQTLTQVTTGTLEGVGGVLDSLAPDVVMVQGDTTSAFAAGLAAFYRSIPLFHVEAGLRTGNLRSPFPEEGNRRLLGQISSIHFPPTAGSRENLLRENVSPMQMHVTGNTVIDALHLAVQRPLPSGDTALDALVADQERRLVLVTAHRRESWGEPMVGIARGIATAAHANPETTFILPVHRNPIVRGALLPVVEEIDNVLVTEPLEYGAFCTVMNRAELVVTDSGGIQEEAPALSKPVLVLRDNTERPEAIEFGVAKLIGTEPERIATEINTLLCDRDAYAAMAHAVNPYGDGRASQRILAATAHYFGRGEAEPDFAPGR